MKYSCDIAGMRKYHIRRQLQEGHFTDLEKEKNAQFFLTLFLLSRECLQCIISRECLKCIKVTDVIEYVRLSTLNITKLNTAHKRKDIDPYYITSSRMTLLTTKCKLGLKEFRPCYTMRFWMHLSMNS